MKAQNPTAQSEWVDAEQQNPEQKTRTRLAPSNSAGNDVSLETET